MKNSTISAIALATLMVALVACVPLFEDTDAIGEDLSSTYGEPSVIDIAPGYQWTYTPTFPSDLTPYLSVTLAVNDGNIGIVEGKTVKVTIPSNATIGATYNVVINASMTSPVEQSADQYVQFRIVNGLSVSGTINDIITGTPVNFTPTGSSDMGEVVWAVKSGTQLPAGLTLSNGKVTGTPTGIGEQTVSLTATAMGQSTDLTVTFTVYNEIVGDSAETITSYGNSVSSRPIAQTGSDLGVTWAVTSGTLPAGFSLNASTGVVSGSSEIVQSKTVTITGTAANGPSQSVTKDITIRSEPALVLTGGADILTFKGNTVAKTSVVTANSTSTHSWSVSGYTGAKINNGTVTVQNPQTAGMDHTITVTVKTMYGQTKTIDINLAVEDTLSISGVASLDAIAGIAKASPAFTVTGGSSNQISAQSGNAGLSANIENNILTVQSASAIKDVTVTITVTSAAGQTATTDVSVNVYAALVFTSAPTGGAIIYAV